MKIGIEKLLSVSASDYVKSQGKELSAYVMKGVGRSIIDDSITVPEGTEVVVDYKVIMGKHFTDLYGTALIPREYFK